MIATKRRAGLGRAADRRDAGEEVLLEGARLERAARLAGDDDQRPVEVDAALERGDLRRHRRVEDVQLRRTGLAAERAGQHLGAQARAAHAEQERVREAVAPDAGGHVREGRAAGGGPPRSRPASRATCARRRPSRATRPCPTAGASRRRRPTVAPPRPPDRPAPKGPARPARSRPFAVSVMTRDSISRRPGAPVQWARDPWRSRPIATSATSAARPSPSGDDAVVRARQGKGREARFFCVQKHLASSLHYDFRIEHDGVLLSWAVPKGPSINSADKRLAMHVEDHPIEYGEFEGVIPEGYGAGVVMLWDRGTWTPEVDDVDAALAKGDLKMTLDGFKLKGSWVLVRTKGWGARRPGQKPAEDGKSWLLIKHKDDWAGPIDITTFAPNSVKSGGRFRDILLQEAPDVWQSHKGARQRQRRRAAEDRREGGRARRERGRGRHDSGAGEEDCGVDVHSGVVLDANGTHGRRRRPLGARLPRRRPGRRRRKPPASEARREGHGADLSGLSRHHAGRSARAGRDAALLHRRVRQRRQHRPRLRARGAGCRAGRAATDRRGAARRRRRDRVHVGGDRVGQPRHQGRRLPAPGRTPHHRRHRAQGGAGSRAACWRRTATASRCCRSTARAASTSTIWSAPSSPTRCWCR